MTQAEFDARKRDAMVQLGAEWDAAWREKRHGSVNVDVKFSGGVPGDLVVSTDRRRRYQQTLTPDR